MTEEESLSKTPINQETTEAPEVGEKLTFMHEEVNVQFKIELELKDNLIIINVIKQNSIPFTNYCANYSLKDLQNKSKFFKVFDYILEAFEDLKIRFTNKNYILKSHKDEKIILSIKTNVFKSDFDLEIPIQKQDISKTVQELCEIIQKQNEQIKEIMNNREPEKKNNEEIEKLKEKNNNLEEEIKSLKEELKNLEKIYEIKNQIYFKESTILENDYEKNLLIQFIEEQDSSKKGKINTKLLFKATIDGDKSEDFHKKCDLMGSTITIVKSENGRRFGGYTSISWDKGKGNYFTEGINFLFSLDTRLLYKNTSGTYHTYHNGSYGPTFGGGHDLYIANECLNNTSSYSSKNCYGMTSSYELNGEKNFKVLDYEVFKI